MYQYTLPKFQGRPSNNLRPKIYNLESPKSTKE